MMFAALLAPQAPEPPLLLHNVAVSPDGNYAITGNGYDRARVIELSTGKLAQTFELDAAPVSVSLTNESAWVATATTAHQFDLDTGFETPLAKFPVPVRSVGWAKAGPVLGTAAGFYVWQANAYVKRLPSGVQDLALDPDGKTVHLAIGKEILQFDFATGKTVARSKSSATGRFLVSSPNGKFVALGREDLAAVLLSTKGYKSVGAVLQDAIPSAIAISPDGQAVAIGGSHSLQILYPFGSKPGIRTRIEGIVNSLAFTPDGDRVIFDQWVPIGPNWLHRLSEWVPASNIDRVLDDDSTIEN